MRSEILCGKRKTRVIIGPDDSQHQAKANSIRSRYFRRPYIDQAIVPNYRTTEKYVYKQIHSVAAQSQTPQLCISIVFARWRFVEWAHSMLAGRRLQW